VIFDRLFRRKPVPPPLRGAPPVRRQKTYSAETGYVYQYFYQGYRPAAGAGRRGNEYVFQVSSDRKSAFPMTVFLPDAALDAWQQAHGRALSPTEQYAAAKMALFQAFDGRADLGPPSAGVEIDPASIQTLLEPLEID